MTITTGTLIMTASPTEVSQLDLVTGSSRVPMSGAVGTPYTNFVLTNGAGALQATAFTSDTRTLNAGVTETLDFSGGVVDTFGNILTFTRLVCIILRADPGNKGNIRIRTGAAAGLATPGFVPPGLVVPPGGCVFRGTRSAAAFAVVAGVTDTLDITNDALVHPGTYDIVVVGS